MEIPLSIQALQSAELAPIVAQVIDNRHIGLLDWQVQPVSGTAGSHASGGLGLFRLIGSATADGNVHPWSVIVKVVGGSNPTGDPTGTNQIPSAWNYWKREILAYRSGMLPGPPHHLVAPRCYGITEHSDDEWGIWLEDIQETTMTWTLERHGIAARHLGQFNGAYLAGNVLPPEQPWMYRGRARDWSTFAAPLLEQFRHYAGSDSGRRWLTDRSVERVERQLANRQSLLTMLDRLPVCLCHHDAFRDNMFARDGVNSETQTVAVDWSMMGYGGIGEEIGITTAVDLVRLNVPGEQAWEMDRITFESYLDGLRDAGWQSDARLARFGYTTTALLGTGVGWMMIMGALVLSTDEGSHSMEAHTGHPLNDILEQWAMVHRFLLDLGDEAFRLADELW